MHNEYGKLSALSRESIPFAIPHEVRKNRRMTHETLKDRVKQRLKALGMSARQASIAAGMNPDTLGKILADKTKSPRGDHLTEIARVLQVDAAWLSSGDESMPEFSAAHVSGVHFGGIVEAGAFRGYDGLDQTAEGRIIPIAPDPRYPAAAQFAYQVVGDSMEKAGIIEGMWVLAVDIFAWERLHGEPGDGKLVIVSRIRDGRPERELTVKRLRIFKDRIELRPESGNPRHMPFVATAPLVAGDVEWIIQAVVLSSTWLFV